MIYDFIKKDCFVEVRSKGRLITRLYPSFRIYPEYDNCDDCDCSVRIVGIDNEITVRQKDVRSIDGAHFQGTCNEFVSVIDELFCDETSDVGVDIESIEYEHFWVQDANGNQFWVESEYNNVSGQIEYKFYNYPNGQEQIGSNSPIVPLRSISLSSYRFHVGQEIINFNDASNIQLTPATPNSNLAEIQIQGGNILYGYSSTPNKFAFNFQNMELESKDEIQKLRITGQSGQSGILIVDYFEQSLQNN